MNCQTFGKLWSLAVGSMDACTGILLVFAPAFTLRLMGVPPASGESLVFLSWMGVFIAGVGLSYTLALRGQREAETVWSITAFIRLLVAAFVTWKIAGGILARPWLSVVFTDAFVAIAQVVMLRRGWWKGNSPP